MKVNITRKTINNHVILHDIDFESVEGINLIMGPSGSGKTTLLRDMVPQMSKVGITEGTISYKGRNVNEVEPGVIGYISQNPDNQIVCDKVWHELAFGLESIGEKPEIIRNRVAEISTYLGIESWFRKSVDELSGGQKQKLCLASILCMGCEMIIMDEPTSMLDPIASREFWELVVRLKEELGINFIVVEHNSDFIYDHSDKMIFMKDGTIADGLEESYLPAWKRIGRIVIGTEADRDSVKNIISKTRVEQQVREPITEYELRDLRHTYKNKLAVNITKLNIYRGINCWIGPNGSGKTTLAKMITGYFGKKLIEKSVLMPQDVLTMFTKETVREELEVEEEIPEDIGSICKAYMDKNPLDLSGGEQHIVAVCKTLMKDADVYILDEPTKGVDCDTIQLIEVLIKRVNKPVIVITHDLELVSRIADAIMFMFHAEVASIGEPHKVLLGNTLYKPAVSRLNKKCLRVEELIC